MICTTKLGWLDSAPQGYDRLFYFMPSQHVESNLANRRLKISKFKKCNDVFELSPWKLDEDQRNKSRRWIVDVNQKIGLICFSRNWRSPIMWGHYGGDGRGVCLVVDVCSDAVQPVTYTGVRRKFDGSFPDPDENCDRLKAFCSTKHLNWSYEQEVRLLVKLCDRETEKDGDHDYLKFGVKTQLAGLINGPNPDLAKSKIKENAADFNDLKFFQCRAAFQRFEMTVQRKKELWK